MKSKLLCLSLTSLFLLGCSKKVEEINFETIQNKISNKDDFIFSITSSSCSHCNNLKKEYNKSKYEYLFYELDVDKLLDGVKKNDANSIETYKYLADLINDSFSNITSYALNSTYETYFTMNYEKIYGKDVYVEGYINIVFPLSFFYIDGKISNFEVGDWSSSLKVVMDKYNDEVNNNG